MECESGCEGEDVGGKDVGGEDGDGWPGVEALWRRTNTSKR